MFDDVSYSQERLASERAAECPDCGPTTWIASPAGFVCCGCGQDLEELLPPLCSACGGSRFIGAGGDLIGMSWCHSCNGTGLGPDWKKMKLELDEATKEQMRRGMEKLQEKVRKKQEAGE